MPDTPQAVANRDRVAKATAVRRYGDTLRRSRRPALVACVRAHPGYGLIGGAGSLAGYGIVLWAMTRAPVAMVAGLRESSILFAMVIAALVLKEHIWPGQCLLAGLIAVGAGVLHLA